MKEIFKYQIFVFCIFRSESEDSSDDEEWTEEEVDKVFMWYAELEGCSDVVERITIMFSEVGIKKSKLEVNYVLFILPRFYFACYDTL